MNRQRIGCCRCLALLLHVSRQQAGVVGADVGEGIACRTPRRKHLPAHLLAVRQLLGQSIVLHGEPLSARRRFRLGGAQPLHAVQQCPAFRLWGRMGRCRRG